MESFNDLRNKINLYFDNELDNDDQKSLMSKVDGDPACSKLFNKEKSFRDFIKNNVKRPTVSPEFIRDLKDRIQIS
jgi:hypothetical protein